MFPSCPIRRLLAGLCCFLGLCCFSKVCAQSVTLPLGTSTSITSKAKKSNKRGVFSFGKSFGFAYALGERHAITLGTEYFDFGSFDGFSLDGHKQKDTWKYRSIPVRVGYEYTLTNPSRPLVPVVGAALSYQFSYAREIVGYRNEPIGPRAVYDKRYGMGFGGQLSVALRANVTRKMYLQAQSRLCYVNGLAFTSRDDFGTRFGKVDFSIGAGFRL